MSLTLTCSNCGHAFLVDRATRLKSGWGMSLRAGLLPVEQQLSDYQKVQCPRCGNIETDDRIKSYELFKPSTVIYIVLGLIFILLLLDVFGK
jgi:ribosomal protein S27AE